MNARQHIWPPAARARVEEMWTARTRSATQIAVVIASEFGMIVSKSAVIGVANRAGLAGLGWRFQRGKGSGEGRSAYNDRRRGALAAARAGKPAPPKASKIEAPTRPKVARSVPAGIPKSLRIPLVETREGQCKFIADDPSMGAATCCGHTTPAGSPWCEGHRRLCMVGKVKAPSVFIPFSRIRRAA